MVNNHEQYLNCQKEDKVRCEGGRVVGVGQGAVPPEECCNLPRPPKDFLWIIRTSNNLSWHLTNMELSNWTPGVPLSIISTDPQGTPKYLFNGPPDTLEYHFNGPPGSPQMSFQRTPGVPLSIISTDPWGTPKYHFSYLKGRSKNVNNSDTDHEPDHKKALYKHWYNRCTKKRLQVLQLSDEQ